MAPTTRSYDIKKRESGEELVASLKQGTKMKLYIDVNFFEGCKFSFMITF